MVMISFDRVGLSSDFRLAAGDGVQDISRCACAMKGRYGKMTLRPDIFLFLIGRVSVVCRAQGCLLLSSFS